MSEQFNICLNSVRFALKHNGHALFVKVFVIHIKQQEILFQTLSIAKTQMNKQKMYCKLYVINLDVVSK